MLEDAVKQAIREALGRVGEGLAGFRARYAQRLMIAEVAKTLAGEHGEGRRILCVEGPTGTGKTLAYLLGAIPVAAALERHLVIASATVALQEQLVHRDIPDVARLSGLRFEHVLAKGRGRYACQRNLANLTGRHDEAGEPLLGLEGLWDHAPDASELSLLNTLLNDLESGQWSGDLDSWEGSLPGSLWAQVASSRHTCPGRRCRYFKECAFYRAREGLFRAQVVVANHDLVLADLAMGGGVVLPEPEKTLYIFDEAHHLAGKALAHFSAHVSLRGAASWLRKCPRTASHLAAVLGEDFDASALLRRVEVAAEEAAQDSERLADLVEDSGWVKDGERRYRFEEGVVPEELLARGEEVRRRALGLRKDLERLEKRMSEGLDAGTVGADMAEAVAPSVGFLAQRLENLATLWTLMAQPSRAGSPPPARWVEIQGEGRGRPADVQLSVSPIDASGIYQQSLWSRCTGAVLTSATLTSLGTFDRFRRQVGLEEDDGTRYLRLDSPFDYPGRARLVVPEMRSDPRDPAAHTRELIELLPGLLPTGSGSLVLFSSRRQMGEVAEALAPTLGGRLLVQGELSKQALLERHRALCEVGEGGVIFGLASFAEGVDLPGDLCTQVVIAKLPFSVPTSPVEESTAEWLKSQGGNPFMEISVPDASLRLMQACGRLLRTEEDYGTVTILDRRLVSKRYGGLLLDALPPFTREIHGT